MYTFPQLFPPPPRNQSMGDLKKKKKYSAPLLVSLAAVFRMSRNAPPKELVVKWSAPYVVVARV